MTTKNFVEICELGDNKRYSEMTSEEIDIYIERKIEHDRMSEERTLKAQAIEEEAKERISLARQRAKEASELFKKSCNLEV